MLKMGRRNRKNKREKLVIEFDEKKRAYAKDFYYHNGAYLFFSVVCVKLHNVKPGREM